METIREQTMNKDLGKESKIGIMCATARELAPYLSVMQIRETDECAMHSFHNGTIKDVCTTAVYSGCGKINASITAQLLMCLCIIKLDNDTLFIYNIMCMKRSDCHEN